MKFQSDLPPVNTQKVDWAQQKREMIANPGEWGLVAEKVPGSTITQIRVGKNQHFREDVADFEFANRRPINAKENGYTDRQTDLWGRYVGGDVK